MFETQVDWTFAKLLEVAITSMSTPSTVLDMNDSPICEISHDMNSPPNERVQIPSLTSVVG